MEIKKKKQKGGVTVDAFVERLNKMLVGKVVKRIEVSGEPIKEITIYHEDGTILRVESIGDAASHLQYHAEKNF